MILEVNRPLLDGARAKDRQTLCLDRTEFDFIPLLQCFSNGGPCPGDLLVARKTFLILFEILIAYKNFIKFIKR